MTAHLAASTIVALVALSATLVLRSQRAATRHALLFLALLRFGVPTAWLTDAGQVLMRVAPGHPRSQRAADDLAWLLQSPGMSAGTTSVAGGPPRLPYGALLWAAGIIVCLGVWAWRARRRIPAVRPATEWETEIFRRVTGSRGLELRIVAADVIPGAWGWWRPRVILPDGLSAQLTEAELESVLAHEVAHVGRHDNLVAAIAHAIVSVFWFHPLVWWIERRMLAERETACDEQVLARGSRAEDYVAGILKVCRMSFAGAAGYAGVTGSNLENRMEFIMSVDLNRRSSRILRALLGIFFDAVVVLPIAGGYLSAQQKPPQPVPELPVLKALEDEDAANARLMDGVRLLREKKYADADQAFRDAYHLDPANLRALMGQVEVRTTRGQWDEALQLLQAEVDRNPTRLDLRLALGDTEARAGRYDSAIAVYQDAAGRLEKASKAAGDVYLRLGETNRRKGDTDSAIANLRHALEIEPENAMARTTLALALDAAGKIPEAEREYRSALELDPKNAVAMNNLAYLLSDTRGGDLNEALSLAQRAHELMPNLNEISDTLGWIVLKIARTNEAIALFDELLQKQPANPTFHYHLGMSLKQNGDNFAAQEQLKTALNSDPPEELARKIRRLLETIGQ
jgi:Flp pilus assembly protein TadD/Zn-dependent protease with chaperone function